MFREERNDELCDQIITSGSAFWQRVLKGRRYYQELADRESTGDYSKSEFLMSQIQMLEPEPDENEKWKEYLSEKFKKEQEFAKGNIAEYTLLKRHKMLNEMIKALTAQKTKAVNLITLSMKNKQTEKIVFDDEKNYARYYKKGGNNYHELYNGIKEKPTEEQVRREIEKLKLDY